MSATERQRPPELFTLWSKDVRIDVLVGSPRTQRVERYVRQAFEPVRAASPLDGAHFVYHFPARVRLSWASDPQKVLQMTPREVRVEVLQPIARIPPASVHDVANEVLDAWVLDDQRKRSELVDYDPSSRGVHLSWEEPARRHMLAGAGPRVRGQEVPRPVLLRIGLLLRQAEADTGFAAASARAKAASLIREYGLRPDDVRALGSSFGGRGELRGESARGLLGAAQQAPPSSTAPRLPPKRERDAGRCFMFARARKSRDLPAHHAARRRDRKSTAWRRDPGARERADRAEAHALALTYRAHAAYAGPNAPAAANRAAHALYRDSIDAWLVARDAWLEAGDVRMADSAEGAASAQQRSAATVYGWLSPSERDPSGRRDSRAGHGRRTARDDKGRAREATMAGRRGRYRDPATNGGGEYSSSWWQRQVDKWLGPRGSAPIARPSQNPALATAASRREPRFWVLLFNYDRKAGYGNRRLKGWEGPFGSRAEAVAMARSQRGEFPMVVRLTESQFRSVTRQSGYEVDNYLKSRFDIGPGLRRREPPRRAKARGRSRRRARRSRI